MDAVALTISKELELQIVRGEQTLLDVAVGGCDSYSVKRQTVRGAHCRSLKLVAGTHSYSVELLQTVRLLHCLSLVFVGATVSNCVESQVVIAAHTRLDVFVGAINS